jgi:putative transcription antitermination factor YqgF
MFDYIGIDWGEKICGIAFGDSVTGIIVASNKQTKTPEIFEIIKIETEKRKTSHIVVGLPLSFHGKYTRVTTLVDKFIQKLQILIPDCSVRTIGERGTTKDSLLKLGKSKKYQIDNQSAAEILERYFEKNL